MHAITKGMSACTRTYIKKITFPTQEKMKKREIKLKKKFQFSKNFWIEPR